MLNAQTLATTAPQDLSGTDWVALGLMFVAACFGARVYKRSATGKGKAGRYVAFMLLFALAGIMLLFKPAL